MATSRLGRYSRAVRILKVALPLVALGLMASVFLLTREETAGGLRFSAADFAALDRGLRLAEPRVTGMTDRGEPFVVRAAWALPDGPDPELVTLEAVEAELVLADGRTVTLKARSGTIRPDARRVSLEGTVVVTTSDGYRAETERAEADLTLGTLTVPERVVATGPLGRIEADRLTAVRRDDGVREETVLFEGRVRVVWQPGSGDRPPGTD
jgi:lipopolysaccharide export system protein LptC